jgi:hypothetical protein
MLTKAAAKVHPAGTTPMVADHRQQSDPLTIITSEQTMLIATRADVFTEVNLVLSASIPTPTSTARGKVH